MKVSRITIFGLLLLMVSCANSYKVKVQSTSHITDFKGSYFLEVDEYNSNRYESQINYIHENLKSKGLIHSLKRSQANMIVQFDVRKVAKEKLKYVSTQPNYESFIDENTIRFNDFGTKIGSMKTSSQPKYIANNFVNVVQKVNHEVFKITLRAISHDNKMLWHTSVVSEGLNPADNHQLLTILTSSIGKELDGVRSVNLASRFPSSLQ